MWYGLVVAGVNSILICLIGLKTGQLGFIPANLFCIAVCGEHSILAEAASVTDSQSAEARAEACAFQARPLTACKRRCGAEGAVGPTAGA